MNTSLDKRAELVKSKVKHYAKSKRARDRRVAAEKIQQKFRERNATSLKLKVLEKLNAFKENAVTIGLKPSFIGDSVDPSPKTFATKP